MYLPMYYRVVTAAVAAVLALLGFPATAAATTVEWPRYYVALGDSPGTPRGGAAHPRLH